MSLVFAAYVLAFGAAAAACFGSAVRARRIEDPDTRRGLVALLLASGGWSAAHVGFLAAPTDALKVSSYLAGLIVGFAAVGAWLYFCSAYTGRSVHRNRTVRLVAVGGFAGIVALKLANPIHGRYFTATAASTPFPHVTVETGLLHWLAMGLAYALAVGGYSWLFDLFAQVGADARPLAALTLVTGLPIGLDVIGRLSPVLLDITYEPLGVAVFAVLAMFVYRDRFRSISLAGRADEPVVVLSDDDRVRDFNDAARGQFPELGGALGRPLAEVLPDVAAVLDASDPVLEVDLEAETRYYRVSTNPVSAAGTELGRLVSVTDVTERERYRREVERQNERLERVTSMISHDLRNPLNVAMGHVGTERAERDSSGLASAANALQRMEDLIEDLLTLARTGQPIDETDRVSLADLAGECWDVVATGEADLAVDGDLAFRGDPDRLRQLFENLFRNAIEHGPPAVTVRVGPLPDGFYVEDDGPGIPADEQEQVFEFGYTTTAGGTGFGLAIVGEIAEAHGWDVRATDAASGGARFEVTGVDRVA